MRAFHKFRYEKPSGGTRSPQLVLRSFYNLRLISSAALSLMANAHAAPSLEHRRPATVVCTAVLESVDGATNAVNKTTSQNLWPRIISCGVSCEILKT